MKTKTNGQWGYGGLESDWDIRWGEGCGGDGVDEDDDNIEDDGSTATMMNM